MHFSGRWNTGDAHRVALTSRETETRPGTDPGTGFLAVDVIEMAVRPICILNRLDAWLLDEINYPRGNSGEAGGLSVRTGALNFTASLSHTRIEWQDLGVPRTPD